MIYNFDDMPKLGIFHVLGKTYFLVLDVTTDKSHVTQDNKSCITFDYKGEVTSCSGIVLGHLTMVDTEWIYETDMFEVSPIENHSKYIYDVECKFAKELLERRIV